MDTILEVNNLTKDFIPPLAFSKLIKLDFKHKSPTRALQDVSFSLEKGKILCVLGPNGAGKTTLLKIIATLILPDKGTILFHPFQSNPIRWDARTSNRSKGCLHEKKIKLTIGLIAEEERSFYWRLSGRQNLEFFAILYGLNPRTAKTRMDKLFELFKVDYADKRFDSYSTGMKRRFALMRGIIHNPELLLLDEPTKSLDYTTALNLRNFIKENLVKAQGKTAIFTTHNMNEAVDFADIFMILHKGKLCAIGTQEQLRKQIGNPTATLEEIFLKLVLGDVP